VRSRRRHLYALAELVEQHGDVEQCRDEYLASLDADDGLVVLLIRADEILAAAAVRRSRSPAQCQRCGARLSVKRRRCSRCGLTCR
jgi:tRNA(Ile2) C34 agmatinyltransferase TiaS